jgi:hypothetical protein
LIKELLDIAGIINWRFAFIPALNILWVVHEMVEPEGHGEEEGHECVVCVGGPKVEGVCIFVLEAFCSISRRQEE